MRNNPVMEYTVGFFTVVFQELLEELILPHCELVAKLENLATCFGQSVTAPRGKPLSCQGSDMVLVQDSGCCLLTMSP